MPLLRWLAIGVGLLVISRATPAWAQDKEPEPADPVTDPAVPALRADAGLVHKLEAARDHLKAKAWPEATHLLQELLDRPEDALVAVHRRGKDGREVVCWTGLRTEAAHLLGTLPSAGRAYYEAKYGPQARALLAAAREQGDPERAAEVVRRFPHTAAGLDALALLGAHYLDRARWARAADCFGRLVDHLGPDELPPATLFHAALAFRRAGDRAQADLAWRWLAASAPERVRLGGKAATLADLRKQLERPATPEREDGPPEPSRLEPCWTDETATAETTRGWLRTALSSQEARGLPVVPASVPVVAGGYLIYRTGGGIRALEPECGEEVWSSPSAWSADAMMSHADYGSCLGGWVGLYLDYCPQVLLENALLGTLSTDGDRVYAVDDLPVPPYRPYSRWRGRWQQEPDWFNVPAEVTDAASHSRLWAVDVTSGKLLWQIGGLAGDLRAGELDDTYFLGAPLPLDGRLYVLVEKHAEVSLACLRPRDGALLWKQPIASAPTRLLLDPGRRIQAARPVYADGILVCPTNAGVVVGVDLLTHSLAWAYTYRGESLTQSPPWEGRRGRPAPARVVAEWAAPLTCAHQGKVVFTAPDEESIHCLNLRDGTPVWRFRRAEDDLYAAAVMNGKVLVVGKQACRALDLADGEQVWRTDTGLPSGRGVAAGGVYYLPLKKAGKDREPALVAIDVDKGTVRARIPIPRKEPAGNLLFWQGDIFAQTATAVTAYPGKKGHGK